MVFGETFLSPERNSCRVQPVVRACQRSAWDGPGCQAFGQIGVESSLRGECHPHVTFGGLQPRFTCQAGRSCQVYLATEISGRFLFVAF